MELVDSLKSDWAYLFEGLHYGWCNPPYSETGKWLKKGWEEAQQGFCSVFLVPCPNGDLYMRDYVFGKASEIIFIQGRVAFEAGGDFTVKGKKGKDGKPDTPDKHYKKGDPVSGNTKGSCLIVFNRRYKGPTAISWVNREDMKNEGLNA